MMGSSTTDRFDMFRSRVDNRFLKTQCVQYERYQSSSGLHEAAWDYNAGCLKNYYENLRVLNITPNRGEESKQTGYLFDFCFG